MTAFTVVWWVRTPLFPHAVMFTGRHSLGEKSSFVLESAVAPPPGIHVSANPNIVYKLTRRLKFQVAGNTAI